MTQQNNSNQSSPEMEIPEDLTEYIMQHYKRLLVLERNRAVGEHVQKFLKLEGYDATVVHDKDEALEMLQNVPFDTLVVSEGMSADGLLIRDEVRKREIRVELRVIKDFGSAILRQQHGDSLEKVQKSYYSSLSMLTNLLECYDPFLYGHSARVAEYVGRVAMALDLPPDDQETIKIACYFHDLPQLLNDFEQRRDKALPAEVDPARLPRIRPEDFFKIVPDGMDVRPILRHLQERYDGKGYPDRLERDQIPIGSRIISAADTYVHMISGSSSRKPLKRVNAMDQLVQLAGQAFDPQVVEQFLVILKQDLREGDSAEEKETILVVDITNEDSLFKLKLRDEGHRVLSAGRTRDAMNLLKQQVPDLIISDVDLPDLDGFQFLEHLKKEKPTRSIPFLFLSDKNDSTYIARALRLGADDYLLRTYSMEILFLKIRKVLARAERERGYRPEERRGVSGSLREMGILEIIQILGAGAKTARIELRRESERADIYMSDGQTIYASIGDQEGEDAFYRIMSWEDGEFTIHPNVTISRKNIFSPNEMLLLRVLHRLDEARRQFG